METEPEITDLEKLLRVTMIDFWRKNNLSQKYDLIRNALSEAYKMGRDDRDL